MNKKRGGGPLDILNSRKSAGFWGVKSEVDSDALVIYVYDVISDFWGVGASEIADILDENPGVKNITVRINSPGGDAFDGVAIKTLLSNHPAHVTVHVDGMAASAATIIAMGGDEIVMHEGTMFMVHEPWTFAMGNASELEDVASFLRKVNDQIAGMYSRKTGLSKAAVKDMLAEETWMTPEEALENGFIDSIGGGGSGGSADSSASNLDPMKVVAALESFAHRPNDLVAAMKTLDDENKPAHMATASIVDWIDLSRSTGMVVSNTTDIELSTKGTTNKAAERGEPKQETEMSDTEKAALQADIDKLKAQIQELTATNMELRAQADKSTETLGEYKLQLKESEKSLSETREEVASLKKERDELSDKMVETEVKALVGVKITANEQDRYTRLAKENRDIFDEMIADKPDLKLTEVVTPAEEGAPDNRPSASDENKGADDKLAQLIAS